MTDRPKLYNGWYYYANSGGSDAIFYHMNSEAPPSMKIGIGLYGPFDRFGMAKTDAIRYFEADVETAKKAMTYVRGQNEPGREKPGRKTKNEAK